MSRIIVLLRNYYPLPNAVGVCAKSVISALQKDNDGVEINVVCEKTSLDQADCETIDGVKVFRFLTKRTEYMLNKHSKLARTLNRAFYYFYDLFSLHHANRDMVRQFVAHLKKLKVCDKDVVVPFCAPFESVLACLKAKRYETFKIIPVLYDLYSGCKYTNRNSLNRIIKYPFNRFFEKKMEKESSHILYSGCWEKYLDKSIKSNKATRVEVPLLRPVVKQEEKGFFANAMINCVYCGSFNKKIRKSNLLCSFFKNVFNERKDVMLHILGNGDLDAEIQKLKEEYRENVMLYGNVAHSEATRFLSNCDSIIVVGNEWEKHFPSKMIEAISFSKKIIAVVKKVNEFYGFIAENTDCLLVERKNIGDVSRFNRFLSSPHINGNDCLTMRCFVEFTPGYTASIIAREGGINE